MSSSLPRVHGLPYERYVVAVRDGVAAHGYLYCAGCGASSVTKADFAREIGVTLRVLNRWLDRQPIAQAQADAIRRRVLRVEGIAD
ncbi:MAG TPA: hypothetical protein VIV06_11865 [Candidatus Limnocylindrales bacterium]